MTTVPLATARAQLSKMVDEAVATHERVEITRNGTRVAVILAAEDYDSIIETLDVLSDPQLVSEIQEGMRDVELGRTAGLDEVPADRRARTHP